MSHALDTYLDRLCAISAQHGHDPGALDWPDSLGDDWCFSPELVSLHGSPLWATLDEAQQKRLAFFEAVNFFSLNVHGERYLIGELGRRLYDGSRALSRYLTQFIAEEARHMLYFSGFCERYAQGVFPDRTVHTDCGGLDSDTSLLLVLARINLFEEIVDHYNALMAKDERLSPVVREIHRIHHEEEMRHLAFGRRMLSECLQRAPLKNAQGALRDALAGYPDFVWRQYYSLDAYFAAGLAHPFEVWQDAWAAPAARAHRLAVSGHRFRHLAKLDLVEAP